MKRCTRRLQWCMGHRVYGHENKCGHIHGHNYVGFFTAEAPNLDGAGRVIDFAVMKRLIGGWIDDNWDHGMVMFVDDPATDLFRDIPEVPGGMQRLFVMPTNPTAENIAHYLGTVVCPHLFKTMGIVITRIVIEETENGSAEWTP